MLLGVWIVDDIVGACCSRPQSLPTQGLRDARIQAHSRQRHAQAGYRLWGPDRAGGPIGHITPALG